MMTLRDLVTDFVNRVRIVIEQDAFDRARASVLGAFGLPPKRGPGRPPKALGVVSVTSKTARSDGATKTRRKAPLQLCPVPGCKNRAAPIFGMVCAKHKDVPKAKIKKYREARRTRKLKAVA